MRQQTPTSWTTQEPVASIQVVKARKKCQDFVLSYELYLTPRHRCFRQMMQLACVTHFAFPAPVQVMQARLLAWKPQNGILLGCHLPSTRCWSAHWKPQPSKTSPHIAAHIARRSTRKHGKNEGTTNRKKCQRTQGNKRWRRTSAMYEACCWLFQSCRLSVIPDANLHSMAKVDV